MHSRSTAAASHPVTFPPGRSSVIGRRARKGGFPRVECDGAASSPTLRGPERRRSHLALLARILMAVVPLEPLLPLRGQARII